MIAGVRNKGGGDSGRPLCVRGRPGAARAPGRAPRPPGAVVVALRALRGPERLAVLSPTLPGIARLRRSAALLVASGSMIGASLEGCPKRGQPTEGKNGVLTGRMSGCTCCPARCSFWTCLPPRKSVLQSKNNERLAAVNDKSLV